MKTDLQTRGCKVSVKVAGIELEAGKGTRTPDILLGKKSVMVEGEPVATPQTDKIDLARLARIPGLMDTLLKLADDEVSE